MNCAYRDINGFIFRDQFFYIINRHLRRAADYHPVLGAVVMHLNRQLSFGLDGNPFNLKALALIHRVIFTPGTIDFAMMNNL